MLFSATSHDFCGMIVDLEMGWDAWILDIRGRRGEGWFECYVLLVWDDVSGDRRRGVDFSVGRLLPSCGNQECITEDEMFLGSMGCTKGNSEAVASRFTRMCALATRRG